MSEDFDATKSSTPALAIKLLAHILEKGFQAGGVLAIPIAPALAYFKANGVFTPEVLTRFAGYTAASLIGATGVMAGAKFTQISREGFEDRVYRLHHNTSQHRNDRLSEAGAVLGLAATAYLLHSAGVPLKPLNLLGGAAIGAAAGVGLHVLTKPEDQRTPNQLVNIVKYEVTRGRE
uniref:Uncharacterized protein n=1 Tax=Chlamydomonas leiostraca TaxID=1034604 RepID=A0A7S0RSA7_9CHLO|mmetsp:Transcript_30012/g.76423  ORF Transcript_30012/g.76423 Transcript_30012/m.76423 type:complete len:177 (+) Transcript_30012:174-704(+)